MMKISFKKVLIVIGLSALIFALYEVNSFLEDLVAERDGATISYPVNGEFSWED